MEKLYQIIDSFNPWWKTGKLPDIFIKEFKRNEFFKLREKLLKTYFILSLLGPRQTGKTTILYQLINFLLLKNIPHNRIFYLSCDHSIILDTKDVIDESIQYFEKFILKEKIEINSDRVFIFFDEIQKVKNWANILKYYYDRKLPIQFVISGSASSVLIKNSRESLAGRIEEFLLLPLSFRELLEWKKFPSGKINEIDIFDKDYFLNLEKIYKTYFESREKIKIC